MTTNTPQTNGQKPALAADAVLKPSVPVPSDAREATGIDFNNHLDQPITVDDLLTGMSTMGFQATSVTDAISIINSMISWRSPTSPSARTTIFLGYTSNLVSSGLREVLRYLVQHRHVSAIVTTAGGVEEDLIKCLAPTYLGDFSANGAKLRDQGINRIGNLFVPNDNYCKFEDWVIPIFDAMLAEQEAARAKSNAHNAAHNLSPFDADFEPPFVWTPSTMIERLGRELNDDRSIYTWAARNGIPVFCPALTDGSLGDMLYFHTYKSSPAQLTLDIVRDIRRINTISVKAAHAGMIVLGGGVVKHHIANACLMRNGADAAVYINTGNEFDGSDAGARPDEAVSWGKIRAEGRMCKVFAEATVVWPMIAAGSFVRSDREGRGSGAARVMEEGYGNWEEETKEDGKTNGEAER